MKNLDKFLVHHDSLLHDVLERFNANVCGIAFVVDEQKTLLGVITDGDMRRALLSGLDLKACVADILP